MPDEKKLVLVVDDDPGVTGTLRVVLETAGYEVVCASSAEQGLNLYRDRGPDIVIAELMIEEVDSGAGFVRDLRALGNTAPVYMLSEVGDELLGTLDYSAMGLQAVFQKPLDPAVLVATLRESPAS